ncbi:MAG: hypothetical protein HY762_01995 [Planctomycetes bacterium]|nr:hypothetical protein [Planctomycetota bacterium]
MIRTITIIYAVLFIIAIALMPHATTAFYAGKASVSYFGLGLFTAGLVILISIISSTFIVIKRLEEEFQSLLGNLKTGEIIIIALLSLRRLPSIWLLTWSTCGE